MVYPVDNKFFQESARNAEEAKQFLVLANRILANEKVFDAYGHISVRNPENPNTFLIARAVSPELVTEGDIVELNFEGEMVSGDPSFRTFSERAIHCAVYAARPDVMCVSHPHPLELLPFESTDVPLKSIYHQNVTFFEGIPVFKDLPPECGLLVNTLELGRKLAETLGDKRGVMIRNHGVVVVGESVMRAVYSTITLRDNAKALINAFTLGAEIHYLGYEECVEATWLQFVKVGMQRSWNFWCTNAKKAYSDIEHIEHLR